jgi:hypothetical protein
MAGLLERSFKIPVKYDLDETRAGPLLLFQIFLVWRRLVSLIAMIGAAAIHQ